MLWNHIPDMLVEFEALKLPWPRFTDEEVSSLISYLYYLRYLGNPGDITRGEQLLSEKNCLECHSLGMEMSSDGVPGLGRIKKYASPIYMAQAIWNHQPAMQEMMGKKQITRPTFDGQQISDLAAYVRSVSDWTSQEKIYLSPGNPRDGKRVFEDKGCYNCHVQLRETVGPSLDALNLNRSAADIAGMMWNHGAAMLRTMEQGKIPWPTFEGKEMADLIAYLYFIKFFEPPGDVESGEMAFLEKRCAYCHLDGRLGPDLSKSPAIYSYTATLTSMLNHAGKMSDVVLSKGEVWPLLDGKEMRDIFTYLRGDGGQKPAD